MKKVPLLILLLGLLTVAAMTAATKSTEETAPSPSNPIVPPFTSNYAIDGLEGWTIIDANEDGKIWKVYNDWVRIYFNADLAMDDWLITPPLQLEANKEYMLTFTTRAHTKNVKESLEVKFGNAPTQAAQTVTLMEKTDITEKETPVELKFTPETDGIYYVGFHGVSNRNRFYLYLSNIRISDGVSVDVPGMPEDLTVTPNPSGALSATVSFKAPSTTMHGAPLTALNKIELYQGENLVMTYDNPAPGESLTYEATVETKGECEFSAVGYNEFGIGLTATASSYIGFSMPNGPSDVHIARTDVPGEVTVSWEAVTTDTHGLEIPAGMVTYNLYDKFTNKEIISGLTSTSYTYKAVEDGYQAFVMVGVTAVLQDMESEMSTTPAAIPAGTPYAGLSEGVADGQLHYIWSYKGINGGSLQMRQDDDCITSQDGDGYMFAIRGNSQGQGAYLGSGLVSLEGMVNPTLTLFTYNFRGNSGNPDVNEISVKVRRAEEEEYTEVFGPEEVNSICDEQPNVWGKITVPLNEYAGEVILFQITGICYRYTCTAFDNIQIAPSIGNDLKIEDITAPAIIKAGNDFKVMVKVVNAGTLRSEPYTIDLFQDGILVESKEGNRISSGSFAEVEFSCSMSPIATSPVRYYAVVNYPGDENPENNRSTDLTVEVSQSTLPHPSGLVAGSINSAVKLTWDEPTGLESFLEGPVTEDFENGLSFSAEFGNWRFVDVDQSPVGTIQGVNLPGIAPDDTTGSFWIFDNDIVARNNPTFKAYSGSKYLFSLFRYDDGPTNDWAISPALSGEAQTITFYARSYNAQYPEKIQVYWSATGTEVEDFQPIESSLVKEVPESWTIFTVNLPEGASHFAIRSFATGGFLLLVDDVTYSPAPVDLIIMGYNVYRDGVKLNEELIEGTSFTDSKVADNTEYTYVVTAVYDDMGESSPSDPISILYSYSGTDKIHTSRPVIRTLKSNIIISNASGMPVCVVAADGQTLFSGIAQEELNISAHPGVYIVSIGQSLRKLIVK